ncbi:aryl-sulfate sulfotransferase [Methylobacterium mesophilicum]|uniref:aryl-sulfate sulfotransferase n=1 Tax=Methylobacterium mesophilicum TaxID=39956 RepID=UPI002F349D07
MNAHDLRLRLLAVGAFVVGWPAVVNAAPTVYPRGVTIHDGDAAYPTDVMFSAADGNSYLIDMDGKVLKTWPHKGEPAKIVDPALIGGRKGVVGFPLDLVDSDAIPGLDGVGLVPGQATKKVDKTFGLVTWDGKVLWQWSGPASVGAALQHHDWDRLPNGNMLILSYVMRDNKAFSTGKIVDDMLYEVDQDGKVVWSWSATDHLREFGFTADQLKLVHASTSPDYLHVNAAVALGPNHWEKAGDKRFAADNIIFSSRNANLIAIISRETGHVVWRMGPNLPPQAQGRTAAKLPRPVDQTSGQHDVHMIPDGLPGAGNLLVFDNEGEAGYPPVPRPLLGGSRILEIDPVADTVVWQYVGSMSDRPNWTFFSPFISSAQRLPNGNTLID